MRRIARRYGHGPAWFWEQDPAERTALLAEDRVLGMSRDDIKSHNRRRAVQHIRDLRAQNNG